MPILFLLAMAAACAPEAENGEPGAAPAADETQTPQDAPLVVSDTPEDSVIFAETMAWVRESRTDTLPIGEMTAAVPVPNASSNFPSA